jgi:hypothetical protein
VARSAALILLCTTILFIPLLFGTPLPFGPEWASDFLAFFVSGIGYTVMGAGLERSPHVTYASLPLAHKASVQRP